ncbi:hypothetical protein FWK35_00021458 [Aphis craccivora]|uniref:Uncharacterized protein n=1 Tax=Aphis craccivora TaxID=307492 RepID=A0A6G0W0I7_APHCR|nr:hypothetical protein FWK35_00021458 [Aphis craccivora]
MIDSLLPVSSSYLLSILVLSSRFSSAATLPNIIFSKLVFYPLKSVKTLYPYYISLDYDTSKKKSG